MPAGVPSVIHLTRLAMSYRTIDIAGTAADGKPPDRADIFNVLAPLKAVVERSTEVNLAPHSFNVLNLQGENENY